MGIPREPADEASWPAEIQELLDSPQVRLLIERGVRHDSLRFEQLLHDACGRELNRQILEFVRTMSEDELVKRAHVHAATFGYAEMLAILHRDQDNAFAAGDFDTGIKAIRVAERVEAEQSNH